MSRQVKLSIPLDEASILTKIINYDGNHPLRWESSPTMGIITYDGNHPLRWVWECEDWGGGEGGTAWPLLGRSLDNLQFVLVQKLSPL